MALSRKAKQFYDDNVPRHGYISSKLKARFWEEAKRNAEAREKIVVLGKQIRAHVADVPPEKREAAAHHFLRLQREAKRMSAAEALDFLLAELGPRESAITLRRRALAMAIIAGRKAERQGGYELGRGIKAYNRWLGVNLQQQARELARLHGPIVVLDAGGGVGLAMADLKSRVGKKLKEAHVTSLTPPFAKNARRIVSKPYADSVAPTLHVAHVEQIPLPSSSVHLITSVRGATWYTPRTIVASIKELSRTLRPGGRAFLHLTEPTSQTEERLARFFDGEELKYSYLYGVVAAKREEGEKVKNVIHVVETKKERDELAEQLQREVGAGVYDHVTKYRSLRLEKQ